MRSPSLKAHYAVLLHIKVLKNILNMRRTHWRRPRRSSERTNLTRWKRQGYVNFQCFKNESLHYKMVCGFTKKIMFCGWIGFFFSFQCTNLTDANLENEWNERSGCQSICTCYYLSQAFPDFNCNIKLVKAGVSNISGPLNGFGQCEGGHTF